MGATKELSNNYQDMVIDQYGLATNNRLPCEDKKVVSGDMQYKSNTLKQLLTDFKKK